MVDMTDLSSHHGSDASSKRLKSRRAAETRLRIYGICAITLAGLALVALLWSVVGKASGALTETYISLDVTLDQATLDPDQTGDPDVIGKADFVKLTKEVLRDKFPTVKSRGAKRDLYDVTSAGAPFELRDHVLANPRLVGQTIRFDFLASDIVDLYNKGFYGTFKTVDATGEITLTEAGKNIEISAETPIFAGALKQVRRELERRAKRIEAQAKLQQNGIDVYERRLANAADEDAKADAERQLTARRAKRDQLLAKAEDLRTRSLETTAAEELDDEMPSVLLKLADGWVKLTEITANSGVGKAIALPSRLGTFGQSDWELKINTQAEVARKVSDNQAVWIETLKAEDRIKKVANWRFFTAGDSREPELAGIWGAAVGSFWTMLVTFCLSFPIGVLAAIYLEEFAPKNRWTDFVEVNINNLAAVPSIVFGLLGLSVFLGVFGVPRSAPLAGGIVLALMTLPTIIIASRASIRAVPPSIRDAALGLGASKLQTAFHHVFPLAMPGILTGTIIGMAQALGETAPLLMIGMVAFIVDVPTGITDSASVLPVQVFRWSDFPERAFEARTAAAICVLLAFLVVMNALAVFLRKRFERRW